MKTYEMVAMAEENGKTYKTDEMYYNSKKGFHEYNGGIWEARAYDEYSENGRRDLHAFIMTDGWEEVKVKKVKMSEIEEMFGHKIEIID